MKHSAADTSDAAKSTKTLSLFLGAIPFLFTTGLGVVVTAVGGLLVYANVADPKSRDLEFIMICLIGTAVSAVAGYVAARRWLETEASQSDGQAVSLLRKYRRAIRQTGADKQAGQYHIGESYLRELLGRRGA